MRKSCILLVIISIGATVRTTENDREAKHSHPLALDTINLELELEPETAESSYTRVIAWKKIPNFEDLQPYFDQFDLLKVEEKQLTSEKLDIIEISDRVYERFLYTYSAEQQRAVTIFIKVDFKHGRDLSSSSIDYIGRLNKTLNKYGLTAEDVVLHDEMHSDDVNSWNTYVTENKTAALLLIIGIVCGLAAICYWKQQNTDDEDVNLNEFKKEIEELEETLGFPEKSLPRTYPDVAISYTKIGTVYYERGDLDQALLFSERARAIQENCLPPNHLDLAISDANIGMVYYEIGDLDQALLFSERARAIQEICLPPNHPDLALTLANINAVRRKKMNNRNYYVK